MVPPQWRWEIDTALLSTDAPFALALYSGVAHGFDVRVNTSDLETRFAKQAAFAQAVCGLTTCCDRVRGRLRGGRLALAQ